MNSMKLMTIVVHAFLGWTLCAATMGIGLATMPLHNVLIIHAIAAPIFFALVSVIYFKKFNYTRPLETALLFVGLVIALDFFIVALFINRSLEMFASLLGTWIPFALIFSSTYVTGMYLERNLKRKLQLSRGESIPSAGRRESMKQQHADY